MNYRFIIFLLLSNLLIIFDFKNVNAQRLSSLCHPDLTNFSYQSYKAHRQNWGISQNPISKFLYFANSKGLLEFDGTQWTTYELPAKQVIRSVMCNHRGEIYTGALGEFGYWKTNSFGELIYHSLKNLITDPLFNNEEIWNIIETPNGILFQSFAYIYLYKNNSIIKLQTPGTVLFVFNVNNRFLLEVLDKGLYELKGKEFIFVPKSDFLKRESTHTILPCDDPIALLIGTNKGLYSFDGKKIEIFNQQTQQFIRQNQLNAGIRLKNGNYVFGTILNGLILTDAEGNILNNFNQKNGLQNNTVLSLQKDLAGNLWIGLDKGISMLALSSPFKYYEDIEGSLGTVFDATIFQNNLFLATNHGVYYTSLSNPNRKFSLVPNTQSQTWELEVIDNQLFCGHNNGTFQIEKLKATPLSTITGGLVLKQLKHFPNFLIQGTYTKLCIYEKGKSGKWHFSHTIDNFSSPVKQLEESDSGEIFVNTLNNGIFRLTLSPDLKKVIKVIPIRQNFLAKNLAKINNQIIVATDKHLMAYNEAEQIFKEVNVLKEQLNIKKKFPINDKELWFLKDNGSFGMISQQNKWLELPLKKDTWISDYENLKFFDSTFFFCSENGFSILEKKNAQKLIGLKGSKPLIRSVRTGDSPILTYFFTENNANRNLTFSYYQNTLIFDFCSPEFTSSIKFSYWLENKMQNWSDFSENYEKEFSNLPPGNYVLHLRTNTSNEEANLAFIINAPWYWCTWSQVLYLFLLGSIFYYFYQLHIKRLKKQSQELVLEKEEELHKQAEKSKQLIVNLRNEQLEQDIVRKSEELANSTMQLIKKNELLQKLKSESLQIESQTRVGALNQIIKLIDNSILAEHDWQVFEQNFNQVHNEFFKKLLERYPDLSPGDLKLSAYLRMNLSSKEIAKLLNITFRSVELKRYRLRKKMNLSSDKNLVEWLIGEI